MIYLKSTFEVFVGMFPSYMMTVESVGYRRTLPKQTPPLIRCDSHHGLSWRIVEKNTGELG